MDRIAQLNDNLNIVRQRMTDAAATGGRDSDAVQLVAVTKYVDAELTRELVQCHCYVLGESRPQQLWEKSDVIEDTRVRWQLIGHLQRNKIQRTLPLVELIHSLDSERLLKAVDAAAATLGRPAFGLLEVNISGDETKHGWSPDELPRMLDELESFRHLRITGLMAMASLQGGIDQAEREFAAVRELRDALRNRCPPNVNLDELSMGMSRDFEAAIRQGATLVRVGSILFEGLDA